MDDVKKLGMPEISKLIAYGGYPDNCRAMVRFKQEEGWLALGYKSYNAWRVKTMPKRKNEADELNDAGFVQLHLVGEDRIGSIRLDRAVALSEAFSLDRLMEVVDSLGGLKKACKCRPAKIRDAINHRYPGLLHRREIEDKEKEEYERVKNEDMVRFIFDKLPLSSQFEFFSERWHEFVEGDIPRSLRGIIEIIRITNGHAETFRRTMEQSIYEINDPMSYLFKDINTCTIFDDLDEIDDSE